MAKTSSLNATPRPSSDQGDPLLSESATIITLYGVLASFLIAPIWMHSYPPLLDYPNHLARVFIILHQDNPLFERFYQVRWAFIPNLGMDLTVAALGTFMHIQVAGKLFISITLLLLTSAPLAISFALERQVHVINLIPMLFTYGLITQYGFLSFLLSAALSLWFFAIYLMLEKRSVALAVGFGTLLAATLMLTHLYGFIIYGALVGSHSVVSLLSQGGLTWKTVQALLVRGLQGAVPLAALLLWGPEGGEAGATVWSSVGQKISAHLSLLKGYSFEGQLAASALLGFIGFAYAWKLRWPVTKGMTASFLLLYLLYWVAPHHFRGGWYGDVRLLVPLGFVAGGVATAVPVSRNARTVIGLALVALIVVQAATVQSRWLHAGAIQARALGYLQSIKPGARVLPLFLGGTLKDAETPVPYTHIVALGVIENCVFTPSLFSYHSQQPLRYADNVEHLRAEFNSVFVLDPNIVNWSLAQNNFDYILVLDHDGDVEGWKPRIPIPTLIEKSDSVNVMLLRITNGDRLNALPPTDAKCPSGPKLVPG